MTFDRAEYRRRLLINGLQTVVVIVSTLLIMSVTALVMFGWLGFWVSLVFVGISLVVSLGQSGEWTLRMYGAAPLPLSAAPRTSALAAAIAESAGLERAPRLYYLPPSPTMNAFAVNTTEGPAIALSLSLLRDLNAREIAGVLAHEISHILHNDLTILAFSQTVNRVLLFFANFMQLMLILFLPLILFGQVTLSLPALLLASTGPLVAIYLQLYLSRLREYRADMTAVGLTEDPRGLASALARLRYFERYKLGFLFLPYGQMEQMPEWLKTHPDTARRIEALLSLNQPLPSRYPFAGHGGNGSFHPIGHDSPRRHWSDAWWF